MRVLVSGPLANKPGNGGGTWERMPAEGLASERIWTLAVDPASADRHHAASQTGGSTSSASSVSRKRT